MAVPFRDGLIQSAAARRLPTVVARRVAPTIDMHLNPTSLLPSDIPGCLRLWGARDAYTAGELEQAGARAAHLLKNGHARGTLLRDADGRPVAHGLCVFVTESFADRVLAAPHALVGKRVLVSEPDAIVTHDADIAAANAGAGLHMLVVNQGGEEFVTVGDAYNSVVAGLVRAFFELHRGYRLARIVNEVTQEVGIRDVGGSDAFASRQTFEYVTPTGTAARTLLATITRDEAIARRSLLMPMFAYTPPTVLFAPGERELLRAAVEGATDPELAERLRIPVSSVKARWRRIHLRVAQHAAGQLPVREGGLVGPTRGSQVRHVILRFVREHPEELTPYARRRST